VLNIATIVPTCTFKLTAAGNIKATAPIAFTTAVLSWAAAAFPAGFQSAGQAAALRDEIRWGADYLMKVHRSLPAQNLSLLVTRVGDIDSEVLLWYRPEDAPPGVQRSGYAIGMDAGAADLGGSVAAALAAASQIFRNSPQTTGEDVEVPEADAAYADSLLAKALEVYDYATALPGALFTSADFNASLLYNSSSAYDDLAWAAAWLYRATKEEKYLQDMYKYYEKHLDLEAENSDWKYAFDWDNVFWPVNVLMAQVTGKNTFKQAAEEFLKNWVCANNVAEYTMRGRAFNPWSGETVF
jgi:endoglucanase